jgi:hypothetical protein
VELLEHDRMKYQVVMHLFFSKTDGTGTPLRDIIDFVVDSEMAGDDSSISAQIQHEISRGADLFHSRMDSVPLALVGSDTIFCHPIEEPKMYSMPTGNPFKRGLTPTSRKPH